MTTSELHHIHSLLEPDEVLIKGNQKRYKETARTAKNKWLDNLTPEERERLRLESEQEFKNVKYE